MPPSLLNISCSAPKCALRMNAAAGVTKIMVTGTSLHSTKEALRLTRLYPNVLYSTAGIHPHDAKSWEEDTYRQV